ncbi:MAG: TorF family putative porin [Sphingobium sp.]
MRTGWFALLPLWAGGAGGPALAQAFHGPSLSVEASSDYRERGLSWSRGAPTLAVSAALPVAGGIDLTGAVVGLRGSERAEGADVGATLGARYAGQGIVRPSAGIALRLFPGRPALSYWEVDARADYDLGPATFGAGISYVPAQDAIGGDNLYVEVGAAIAVPAKPIRLSAGVGHSSGGGDGRARAGRLRPRGDYADWRVGIDYLRGPFVLGLRYTDTAMGEGGTAPGPLDRHIGARLSAFLRWDL